MLALALLLATALAQQGDERASWNFLQQAQLLEAGDGDLAEAAKAYQVLVRTLQTDDPFRGEVLYSLGRAHYLMGDIQRAREALKEGIRTNTCEDTCNALLRQLELEASAIREIPVTWTFDDTEHGFFHPWEYAKRRGSIRIDPGEANNPALRWETVVDPRESDMLVVGFDHPRPTPTVIRLKMQSDRRLAAQVEILIIDDRGNVYHPASGRIPVPALKVMNIELKLSDFVPMEDGSPPFDAARMSRFEIHDTSAAAGAQHGTIALYIDDFEVR
jgi:tetratricopeptide (TPR) repeat protein